MPYREILKATSHLTISMRWSMQRVKFKGIINITGTAGLPKQVKRRPGVFDLHTRDASECQKSLSEKCLKPSFFTHRPRKLGPYFKSSGLVFHGTALASG